MKFYRIIARILAVSGLLCLTGGYSAAQETQAPKTKINISPAYSSHRVDYSRFWIDGKYCRQNCADFSKLDQGLIFATVESRFQEFKTVSLPKSFMEWNIKGRLSMLDNLGKGMMPTLSGPHSGMVASRGFPRSDSVFSINNAVKGMGFLPKAEHMQRLLDEMNQGFNDSMEVKIDWLKKLYTERLDWLDWTNQVSLELYATPEFATHTFLNQMTDPAVSIVFLDMRSFELRAITQLIHPDDPNLSETEKRISEYVNGIHDYFHGRAPRKSIVAVYHVIEVFDNSPGRGRGKRIIPSLP